MILMYQNFDEKYVSINYDDGSSATVTQTTLAYWDHEYGKKVLSNDEQLNMYMRPKVSPAIKYLMLDNMQKLVDVGAFIRVSKEEDALGNIKYNFHTKRNVRYTIVFEAGFNEINGRYLMDFEELYNKQMKLLEEKKEEEKEEILDHTVTIEKVSFDYEAPKKDINDFLKDAEIEEVNEEENIEETKETEDKKEKNVKIDYDEALSFQQERLPKSRVIINETNSEDEEDKQEVDIASLDDILDDLDLE